MQIEKLRSLIREAVDNQLKEIEAVAEAAAMEARLAEYDKAMKTCESKIQAAENLEEVKDLMDENKINELKKKLKSLTKAKEKLEKAKAKKNKGKEVTTDAETDKEESVDEMDMKKNAIVPEMEYTMDEMDMKEEALNESFIRMQKIAGIIK
jgi:DNA repair exonuclease SbcCD ATPase subunit